MATFVKYEHYIEAVINKEVDAFGNTDTWRAIICTDAPDVAGDDEIADRTQISAANGYPGTNDIAYTSSRSGGTVTSTATDVVWTASGGNLGNSTTGRYFDIYDDSSTTDILRNYYDYTSTFTVATGETMTLDFGATDTTYA